MSLLTRDDFLKPDPVRYHEFPLPGGKSCRIRSLPEREKAKFENSALDKDGKWARSRFDMMRARLIALCVVDAKGSRILNEDDPGKLLDKDGGIMAKIYDACRKHVGFEEGDIEGLVKNSEPIVSDASPSS